MAPATTNSITGAVECGEKGLWEVAIADFPKLRTYLLEFNSDLRHVLVYSEMVVKK